MYKPPGELTLWTVPAENCRTVVIHTLFSFYMAINYIHLPSSLLASDVWYLQIRRICNQIW